MSIAETNENKWRKRLWRLTITSSLMGVSFAVGVTVTILLAIRLLLPMAMMGIPMGMHGVVSASVHSTMDALYSGDSATRLSILTQLKQTINDNPTMTFDVQTSAWLLPAIEPCQSDRDPEVAALSEELVRDIRSRTTHSSK